MGAVVDLKLKKNNYVSRDENEVGGTRGREKQRYRIYIVQ